MEHATMAGTNIVLQVKKNALNKRLDLLARQYEAAANDFDRAISGADRVKFQHQMDDLERDLAEVAAQIEALDRRQPNRAAQGQPKRMQDHHRSTLTG